MASNEDKWQELADEMYRFAIYTEQASDILENMWEIIQDMRASGEDVSDLASDCDKLLDALRDIVAIGRGMGDKIIHVLTFGRMGDSWKL